MSVTEQDIKALTPEHRIVWKDPGAPREVGMGLWVDGDGDLLTDMGHVVRRGDGFMYTSILDCIVRIIEPPFTPRVGMVIGKPGDERGRLVCLGPDEWCELGTPWSDADARNLIENCGWEVVDDLTKGAGND